MAILSPERITNNEQRPPARNDTGPKPPAPRPKNTGSRTQNHRLPRPKPRPNPASSYNCNENPPVNPINVLGCVPDNPGIPFFEGRKGI